MMTLKFKKRTMIAALLCATLVACIQDDDGDFSVDVDQTAFLSNTSITIVDAYQDLNLSVSSLSIAIDSLAATASEQNLTATKAALKAAYLNWQKVSPFEFGPAKEVDLKSNLNIFKTDTAQIELNVSSGNYDFDQIAMKDAIGFPALDYLLNASSSTITLNKLKSNTNRCAYLKAVSDEIKLKVSQVNANWSGYQTAFNNQTGTDVGSSTGMLINSLNQHFEKYFRDNKLGIPLGVRSSGIAKKDYVEAVYGAYSVELALENLKGMEAIYTGNSGYGLDDYLIASNASDLNESILSQLAIIKLKLNALSDPLQDQIQNNPAQVQEAYNEMQKLIVLWKVDMPSRLGILITYQDNDGD